MPPAPLDPGIATTLDPTRERRNTVAITNPPQFRSTRASCEDRQADRGLAT
jgi:hypothetical protein